ncbi:MAG TPA: hypothetical protein VMG98_11730, partial [Verrucomicrobiae bacterium]|nr:hypothetical protein [Verrucomicrobiae bacterium]
RQVASSNSFNYRLLQDIALTSAFAGFISLLIQLEGRGLVISLMPDRDKITEAYGAWAYLAFAINASSFALRHRVPEAQLMLGLPGPRTDGKSGMYYDELVRVPDYIAGAIASTDFSAKQTKSLREKHDRIVVESFADNPSFMLFNVALQPDPIDANRIVLTKGASPAIEA